MTQEQIEWLARITGCMSDDGEVVITPWGPSGAVDITCTIDGHSVIVRILPQ